MCAGDTTVRNEHTVQISVSHAEERAVHSRNYLISEALIRFVVMSRKQRTPTGIVCENKRDIFAGLELNGSRGNGFAGSTSGSTGDPVCCGNNTVAEIDGIGYLAVVICRNRHCKQRR